MKKVLIPTDFTVNSLQLIEYAILNYPDTKLNIILTAGYKLPDNKWSIIHFNKNEQVYKQVNNDFLNCKRSLLFEHKNNIQNISFELFIGVNSIAFLNFIEQLDVHHTIIPKDNLKYTENKWFDITKLLKKNVKEVIEVQLNKN